MTSLSRPNVSPSTKLLLRILERPGLVAAVRELPGAVLGKLIDRIGLEDAGELVALATTAQLERVFDDDLWRADRAGGDETFQPERFALWLRVMLEAGEDAPGAAVVRAAAGARGAGGPSAGAGAGHGRARGAAEPGGRGGRRARARARDVGRRGVGGVSADRARSGRVGRRLERARCRSIAITTIGCGRFSSSAAR